MQVANITSAAELAVDLGFTPRLHERLASPQAKPSALGVEPLPARVDVGDVKAMAQ